MQALAAFLALVSTMAPQTYPETLDTKNPQSGFKPTHSQFIEQKYVGQIRDALEVFYHDCGFYPDALEKLTQATESYPSCLHGGRAAPLKNSPQIQDAIDRLTYTPFGYEDFELSLKLFWTRGD